MKRPDFDWDADLSGEPLRRRMFTPELAARIRAAAEAEAFRQTGAKTAYLRRVMHFCAMTGCLSAAFLLAMHLNGLTPVNPAVRGSSGEMEAVTVGEAESARVSKPAAEPSAAYPSAETSDDAARTRLSTLNVLEPSEVWRILFDQSYPFSGLEMLFGESVGDGRYLMVSSKITTKDDSLYGEVSVNLFVLKQDGWHWESRMSYTLPGYLRFGESRVLTGWFSLTPEEHRIDIFTGFLTDPDIAAIRVVDDQDGVYEAKLFPASGGVKIWFARTPERTNRRYKVEGLDWDGNVVYVEYLNWHSMKKSE